MFNKEILGKRIKKVRGKKSQDVFASELGISRGALSFYENGERTPDAEIIYKICELCNISADYLLGFTDNSTTDPDLKAICNYTGLCENAVNHLHLHFSSSVGMGILRIKEIANDVVLNFLNKLTMSAFDLENACKDWENCCLKNLNENGATAEYSNLEKMYSEKIDLAMYDVSSELNYFLMWYNIRYTRKHKPFNPFKSKTYEEVFEELKEEFLEKETDVNGEHNPPKE